jgi:hypothetical protein
VKISINSFDLLDNALATATITGTVALESYIRKKPAILFGRSQFEVNGVHLFDTCSKLADFLTELIIGKIKIELKNKDLLSLCAKGVASGLTNDDKSDINYHSFSGYQENAHFILLTKMIEEKIDEIQQFIR